MVFVGLVNTHNVGLLGAQITLHATGGYLEPLPLTDSTGQAQTIWRTQGAAPGKYAIQASYNFHLICLGEVSDTDSVTVLP